MPEIVIDGGPINYPYTAIELTTEALRVDNVWGVIRDLDLFPIRGLTTTTAEIAYESGRVRVLGSTERGAAGSEGGATQEDSRILKIPHFPHKETIKPDDLQDRFAFGSARQQLRSLDTETSRKLEAIRRHHAQTLDFLRMGALKGEIRDGRFNVLYDLFQVFDVQKKVVYFDLADAESDIHARCEELADHMEQRLRGETMTIPRALVSGEFWTAFRTHPKVEKYYLSWEGAGNLMGRQMGDFEFGGVAFRPVRAATTGVDGTPRRYIESGLGHAYPMGTTEAHATYAAPPYHVDLANTVGPELFISPEVLRHGEGVELKSQSNVLPVWHFPELLVEVDAGAASG